MGSCRHVRFATSLVAHAPVPATTAAGKAWLPKDVAFLRAPELKDWS